MEPWIWAVIIAVLLVVEFITMGLVSIWFALGAVVGFVLSFFGIPWYWEVIGTLVAAFVLLASTRRFVVRFLNIKAVNTNADSMIGKETLLLEDIDSDKKGSVRLNGTTWTALSEQAIEHGSKVKVIKLEGNTVWVEKTAEPAAEFKPDEKSETAQNTAGENTTVKAEKKKTANKAKATGGKSIKKGE